MFTEWTNLLSSSSSATWFIFVAVVPHLTKPLLSTSVVHERVTAESVILENLTFLGVASTSAPILNT
jgi:hypothetical protein